MNDSTGEHPLLQSRAKEPISAAKPDSATRQTSILHSSSASAASWKPRHGAATVAAQDQMAAFTAQAQALAASLPEEGAYARIRQQILQAVDEAVTPTLLAICNDAASAQNTSAGETAVQAVTLQYAPSTGLTTCGVGGAVPLGALPVLQNFARNESSREAIERFLLALLRDLPGSGSRDAVLLFLPGSVAVVDGSWESAARLLRRAQMIFWLTDSTPTATASSVWSNRPVDLLAVDLQSVFNAAFSVESVPGQTDLPLDLPVEAPVSPGPQLVLRDVQEKAALLFQDSRLLQMQAALLHLSASPQERDRRMRLSVRRIQAAVEELTHWLAGVADSVNTGFQKARAERDRLQGSQAIREILPVWEARQAGPCDWLTAHEENAARQEALLPTASLNELQNLRSAYAELSKERRSQEREEARVLEERRFLERRLEELRQPLISAEDDLALQLLSGILGEGVGDPSQQEITALEEQLSQCLAEEARSVQAVENLALRSEGLAGESRQFAANVVQHLRSACIESADAAERRHAGLRKARWELQANAGAIAAAASMARACQTLEESASDFGEATEESGCVKALRACRHACENLLHLREAAGNAHMLRIYRRILSIELQAMAETVNDCSGVLHAIDLALSRVPAEELWRELSLFTAKQSSPLAHFALHLCGWLCKRNPNDAEAAGHFLAQLRPCENILSEVGAFLDHHAASRGSEFLGAMLAAAPQHKREVLRRAPRNSRAYRQALMMIGAELLNVFATPLE